MRLEERIVIAVILEFLYAIVTRTWLRAYFDGIERELLTTACRAVSAAAIWALFRQQLVGRQTNVGAAKRMPLGIALLLLFLTPVVIGQYSLPGLATKAVFVASMIVVAVREEFAYRWVLQNLLERRYGPVSAILFSNVAFVLYHYGMRPMTPEAMIEYFAVGSVLGLIYLGTGSLALAIGVHAAYDVIWVLSPFIASPWPKAVGTCLQIAALALCVLWIRQVWVAVSRPGSGELDRGKQA